MICFVEWSKTIVGMINTGRDRQRIDLALTAINHARQKP
jgi:hypothetical protein